MADARQEYEVFKKRAEYEKFKNANKPITAQERVASFEPKPATTTDKGFMSDFPVGAFVGGTVGAISGGGTPASIPLAGLGAAGGEAAEQLIKRGINTATGANIPVPETGLEAAKKIAYEGALGTLGEGVGRGAVFAGNKALHAVSGTVTPAAKDAIRFMQEYIPTKERSRLNPLRYLAGKDKASTVAMLPAEATENRVLDILHNITESSIIGGNRISEFKTSRTKLFDDIADDIINSYGQRAEPDLAGELFMAAVDKNIQPSRLLANSLYNTAAELGKNAQISTSALKSFATPLSKMSAEIGGVGSTASGDDLVKAVLAMPDTVDYATARELRSRLLSVVDEFSIANKKAPAIGKARKFIGLIDEATEKGLTASNPEALKVWREANKVYREGSEAFDNQFIRRLVKSADPDFGGQPEAIVKSIFKPGAVSNIRRAKVALGGGDTHAWKNMQSHYVQSVLSKSTNKQGELLGANLNANLFGKSGMGDKALGEIFKPEQLTQIKRFAGALESTQARQSEGTGRVFIQLTQAGAILGLATGLTGDSDKLKGTSAAILLGPAVLSRAFTNPAVANVLIKGIQGGVKTKASAGALSRFLTDVVNMQWADKQTTGGGEE